MPREVKVSTPPRISLRMAASLDDLELLYRERFVGFKRALASITGDYGTAEEALQDAFVRAMSSLPEFRGDCPLAAWVWRIAQRSALEGLRRGTRQVLTAERTDEPQLVAEGHDPRLVEALRTLPPRRRLIVFLRYFADCSYAEIAAICEISEGTVAAALTQARTALAAALDLDVAADARTEKLR
jgi:RNA polymerase sigma factor (sigma-70 family)